MLQHESLFTTYYNVCLSDDLIWNKAVPTVYAACFRIVYVACSNQGLKRGLVVSKRLTEAHIWLIVNLIRAIVETIVK